MSRWRSWTARRRSQSERDGKRVRSFAADLEIDAGIGLDEPLVGRLAREADLAVGPDFRRRDHPIEDIFELVVEILDDPRSEDLVEREAADQQERGDPERRDDDHAPRQRSLARWLERRRFGLPIRRRHRGGLIVQPRFSSGSSSV